MSFLSKHLEQSYGAPGSLRRRVLKRFKHRSFKRFMVLTRSRTGSNMLMSFLNSHPNARADGEVFSKLNGRDYRQVLAEVYARQPIFVKAKGFKIFYYHPLDGQPDEVLGHLRSQEDLCVIHLKRRNILRTLISRKIAGLQGLWAVDRTKAVDKGTRKSVSFSADELEEGFQQTRAWEEAADRAFERHPLISVHYEDLVANRDASFERVLTFLGLPALPLETNLRRQNPESLRALVTNYDSLKSAFAATPWRSFFDE
ncbi:sulfotransferase [Pelagibius sp.]|uniref:sulfotransferase n=1 Tax=Pelagibius sp. TaxID=1931238 RepID=UPI003B50402C